MRSRCREAVAHPVIAILWLAALLAGCRGEPAARESVPEAPPPPTTLGWTKSVDTVRRGDSFSQILLRNDVYLRDIDSVVRQIQGSSLFSLRRLLPGETVEVTCDADGALRRLAYTKGPDQIFVVERDADAWRAYRTGLAYDIYLRKYGGQVASTVDEALRASGAEPDIVGRLAEIFASDIDFLTEPRQGDRVAVLVEEKRYQGERVGGGEILYAVYEGERARQSAVRFGGESAEGTPGYYTPGGESLIRAFLRSPLNYRRISSRFSHRRYHPVLRVWRPHLGVDYAAPTGTPVVSVAEGVVTLCGVNGGFGRQVCVRHGSAHESWYGHLSRFAKGLKKGARVAKGEVIGYVGATGLATGPHLDFRMKRSGAFIDPLRMPNPPTDPVTPGLRPQFDADLARLAALEDSLGAGQAVLWQPASAPPGAEGTGPMIAARDAQR